MELEQTRALQAATRLDHLLPSDLFQTAISNDAFSVLYLNPPYDFQQEQKRVEHAFLTHCTRYLIDGGLLIFIVPRHRLTVSARYISSNYRDIDCLAFPQPEYEDFDQVVLSGRKRPSPQLNEDAQRWINQVSLGPLENVSALRDEDGERRLLAPLTADQPIIFTTRSIDPVAAATEARHSGLWASPAITDKFWPQEVTLARPLMPLRKGHMAQLVAAGFLDNLSLQTGDERILVKGRTTKVMETVEENDEKTVKQDKMRTTIITLNLDTGEIQDIQT